MLQVKVSISEEGVNISVRLIEILGRRKITIKEFLPLKHLLSFEQIEIEKGMAKECNFPQDIVTMQFSEESIKREIEKWEACSNVTT